MRRFLISAIMLLLCLILCTVSYFSITKQADIISRQLSSASEFLLKDDIKQAAEILEQCEKGWEKSHIIFLIYLDHESFSELEYSIPVLAKLLKFDKKITADKIQRCSAVLEDLIEHQKVTVGNIL